MEFNWERDVPYKKEQEIEKGSFVYDVINYENSLRKDHWSHLRVVLRKKKEILFYDIPKCKNPEQVLLEDREVTIFNQNLDPYNFRNLDNFLKNCENKGQFKIIFPM